MPDYGKIALANIETITSSTVLPELFGASPSATPQQNVEAFQRALDIGGTVRIGTEGVFYINDTPAISSDTLLIVGEKTTIYLMDGVSKNIITNKAALLPNSRDKNITIRGGTFIRGDGSSTGGSILTHGMFFRRVDNLRISDLAVDVKTGKYAINHGDCLKFDIGYINFLDTSSDGVHINGPARVGDIHHIRGITHDDSVALTANDYDPYADTRGDISGIRIYDINTTSKAANIVKVLAGQGCKVDDITIENVRGSHAQHGVWIGDDNGYPSTDNGTHGVITIRDVHTEGMSANSATIYMNLANGAKRLVINDASLSGLSTNIIKIGLENAGVIDEFITKGISYEGVSGRKAIRIEGSNTAKIRYSYTSDAALSVVGGNGGLFDVPSVTIENSSIVNSKLIADDTATTNWINFGDSANIVNMVVSGGYVDGGRCLIHENTDGEITLTGGLVINNINRVANSYTKHSKYKTGEVTVGAAVNPLFMVNSTAPAITITGGDGSVFPATPNLVARSGSQTMRINGMNLKADIAGLTGSLGDVVKTSVVQGDIPAGHPVVSDGANTWKSLINGATWSKT